MPESPLASLRIVRWRWLSAPATIARQAGWRSGHGRSWSRCPSSPPLLRQAVVANPHWPCGR
jgi:hypothetical protein